MTEVKRRGRPPKVATNVVEQVVSKPIVEDEFPNYSIMIEDAVKEFRKQFPADWEALRLCPLQHGLEDMAKRLKNG